MVTKENIRSLIPGLTLNGTRFAKPLADLAPLYEVNTKLRMAHFLSQVGHESGGFRYVREIWGPTPAQMRYEGRRDLGNTQIGDGRKFLGRGLIQVTGRFNYSRMSQIMFGDLRLLDNPQLLEVPQFAVQSAFEFWKLSKLNELADLGRSRAVISRVTRRINGGLNGIEDRVSRFNVAFGNLPDPQ